MGTIHKIIAYIPLLGLLMIISAIPYGWSVYQQIGSILAVGGSVVYFCVFHKWRDWHWVSSKWLYVIMIALYVMLPLRQFFDTTPPTADYYYQLRWHTWFLYTGIIGLLGFTDKLQMRYVAYVMLAASAWMLAHCAWLYFATPEFSGLEPYVRFNMLRRTHVSSHMVMNLYLNTAIIFGFCTIRTLSRSWQKLLMAAGIALAFTLIILSDGRTGLVTSLIIIAVSTMYYIGRRNRYVAWIYGVVVVLASACFLTNHPRMSEAYVKADSRYALWPYSLSMAEEHPIAGYGFSTLSVEFLERTYADSTVYHRFIEPIIYSFPEFATQGKTLRTHHPHNAFLMYWLGTGLPGLLLFIALFVIGACLPVGENRIFLWLFLMALLLQASTEPVGGHFTPQFIALMLFVWEKCTRRVVRADNS